MNNGRSRGAIRLQQLLWVVAGVVVVSLLVAAASWLFSPSSGKTDAGRRKDVVSEATVKNESFRPETALTEKSVNVPSSKDGGAVTPKSAVVESRLSTTTAAPSTSGKSMESSPASLGGAVSKKKVAIEGYAVQVGVFGSKPNAEKLKRRLKDHEFDATVLEREHKFKVLITGFNNRAEANTTRLKLDSMGFHGAFVVHQE